MALSSLWEEVIDRLSSLQLLLHLQSIGHKTEIKCAETIFFDHKDQTTIFKISKYDFQNVYLHNVIKLLYL